MTHTLDDLEQGVIYDFNPLNMRSEHLTSIGFVAASSAQTEHAVEMAIAGMLNTDFEIGGAVTTHINMPNRDHIVRSLAEMVIDDLDQLDRLDKVLDEITNAMAFRNEIIHQHWCTHPLTNDVFQLRIKSRGAYRMAFKKVAASEIHDVGMRIYTAGLDLVQWMTDNKLHPVEGVPRHRSHKSKAERKKRRSNTITARDS